MKLIQFPWKVSSEFAWIIQWGRINFTKWKSFDTLILNEIENLEKFNLKKYVVSASIWHFISYFEKTLVSYWCILSLFPLCTLTFCINVLVRKLKMTFNGRNQHNLIDDSIKLVILNQFHLGGWVQGAPRMVWFISNPAIIWACWQPSFIALMLCIACCLMRFC